MLHVLRIPILARIESVYFDYAAGFSVRPWVTCPGRSIVVKDLALLLGGRAASDLVRTGEAQATIEAIFEDGDKTWLIRREVTSQGRSRSFINGALATATALRELSLRLVELHGQHEHHALLDPLSH